MSIISRIIRKNTMFANFANVMLCSSVLLAGWQQLVLVVRANIWLAPASPSVPPGRNALSPGTAELRTRFAELSPLGGCPLGGSSSQLTFCRLRPWERRGTPFVRSTYTATGPAAEPCSAPGLKSFQPLQTAMRDCCITLANVTTQIIILEACSQE